MTNTIAVIGSSGALGLAFVDKLSAAYPKATMYAFSRHKPAAALAGVTYHTIDYEHEASIAEAASIATQQGPLDGVVVTTGILHEGDILPEKSLQELSAEKFRRLFDINTILPALIVKHFAPSLNKEQPSFLAVLSARVGSISDNKMGGWYAYRASKAALNMVIKTAAIEIARSHKKAVVVGLHPGTVNSKLSKPFQSNVPNDKLFTPEFSAAKLLEVIQQLTPAHSGKCFAWDGTEIKP